MERSSSLSYGTGKPYLAIFNKDGEPIIEPLSNVPLGQYVTRFSYVYDELEDDTCDITIETNNPDINEIPWLKSKMQVLVQWGYIRYDGSIVNGPVRKAIMRDDSFEAGESGFRVTLKLTDGFSLYKSRPADRNSNNFQKWVEYNLKGLDSVKIHDFNVKGAIVKDINPEQFYKK